MHVVAAQNVAPCHVNAPSVPRCQIMHRCHTTRLTKCITSFPSSISSRIRAQGHSSSSTSNRCHVQAAAATDSAGASTTQAAVDQVLPKSEDEQFHEAYAQAFTMSQLYVKNRPAAVPLQEWEVRRKKRDMTDILEAAARRGKNQTQVQQNLQQLEQLMPDLINLNKMKPADWVSLSEDVTGAANKLIILKTLYPKADVFSIVASRPKMLLQSESQISENAKQVKAMLSKAADVDAIIQAVPELSDPATLNRSLAFLAASFAGQDPVVLLQENPKILLNLGESNMEDHAEYGEMTTKD